MRHRFLLAVSCCVAAAARAMAAKALLGHELFSPYVGTVVSNDDRHERHSTEAKIVQIAEVVNAFYMRTIYKKHSMQSEAR
jgi:hypothetical protein